MERCLRSGEATVRVSPTHPQGDRHTGGLHTTNASNRTPCTQVIDAQNGGVVGLVVKRRGQDTIDLAGRRAAAERYRMVTPIAAGDLWYTEAQLVKGRLETRGETVDYVRVA
jgi:hypothetical protein